MTELIVPRRFCGPPISGNGGWTAGALAAHLPGSPTVEVSLRQPPPLDTALQLVEEEDTLSAVSDGAVVASARAVKDTLEYVEAVPFDEARAAEATYPGLTFHPFPSCFACGTERVEGDGLRIFPGAVDRGGVAATWRPHRSQGPSIGQGDRASVPVTWAALDCVGGWAGDLADRLMVLGRMTARVDAVPLIGVDHVVVGAHRGSEGRKTFTAATLYDPAGRAVATAEHIWIAVDPATFGGISPG